MTKPKTPTLASVRKLAKTKGCRITDRASSVDVDKDDEGAVPFLEVFCHKPTDPTRKQALAMIHAALEVLPDVRKK